MNNKIKHLEMIQAVINRMASNSFMLKGWAVTLVSGLFALSAKEARLPFFFIAYIPILTFWGIDSYYLYQERLYRALYAKVVNTDEKDIDFSLSATYEEFGSEKNEYWSCVRSHTEIWFYVPMAGVCALVIIAVCIFA